MQRIGGSTVRHWGCMTLLTLTWNGLGGLALAQTTSTVGPQSGSGASSTQSLEEVVVTGSRIPSSNLRSISPVTTVGVAEIQSTGAIDMEAALRDLPEGFAGHGEFTNNNGNGDTSANLRNLGPQRTLVLIDGKRNVGSDSKGQVDLDAIPIGMIDHVEIVTGGAAAVYGADAVAGVVNVILKKDFTGVQANAQYGAYTPGEHGEKFDASVIGGTNYADGQGNVTGFLDYTRRDPVYVTDRPWAQPLLTSNGTSLVPYGIGISNVGQNLLTGQMFTPERTLVPVPAAGINYTDFSENNFLITPQTRVAAGLNGHLQATDSADLYFRANWSQNQVDRQVLDGTLVVDQVNVNYGNPLLSAQERGVLFSPGPHSANDTAQLELAQDFPQNGPVGELDTYKTYELVTGVRGDLSSHFRYDGSLQYGETTWLQVLTGDMSPERFQQALLVNPNGTCTNPANGCVPLDIFSSAPGAVTAAQTNFLNLVQQATSYTEQWVASASVAGDLAQLGMKSPLAADPVSIAVGVEHRNELSIYQPDPNLAVGNNLLYGSIPPLAGAYRVSEAFFETRVPLLSGLPAAESLEFEGGYRFSSYNLAGNTNTYKFGLVWQPDGDARLRGAYEHAVRAPEIGELFSPQAPETYPALDPCFAGNGAGPTASKALCQATGVPAAAYGQANLQCTGAGCIVFSGGNPNLRPESSDSKTFGVLLTPRFAPDLTLSADYYNITIKDAISTLTGSAQAVFNGCYGTQPSENPTQSPNNIYCQAIQRNAAGSVWGTGTNGGISLLNANVGLLGVAGVDSTINYRARFSDIGLAGIPGSLLVTVKAAYTSSYRLQANAELPSYQCAGTYGNTCGQPIPEWRTFTQLTWAADEATSLSVRWRYLTSVILDADKFSGTITDPPDHEIPAFSYLDLSGSWGIAKELSVHGGVRNVLGKNPPLVSSSIANSSINGFANTFPATYDIGRQLFVGFTGRF